MDSEAGDTDLCACEMTSAESESCYTKASTSATSSALRLEETQSDGSESETEDQGANMCPLVAQLNKRRSVGGSGKFKASWNLPPHSVRRSGK